MANLIKISEGSKANIQGKALCNAISTYTLGSTVASVNEGSSVTFTLSTTNVVNGTLVPYIITGVSSGDLSSGSLTGNFTIASGLASTSVTLANDVLTEGSETMVVSLSSGVASISVVVNDTSMAPTYAIGRSLSAVNEGSSVVFTLSTTNVSNGTVLPYTITGISSNDVTTGSLSGSFTVSNNLATATITLSADELTEGAETATLTLNNAAASNFVLVNDTSLTSNEIASPDEINGLVGWYDYTDGVYKTNGNDFTDEYASFTVSWVNGTASVQANQVNGRNSYVFSGSGNNGLIDWNGSNWTFTVTIPASYDEETGDLITPELVETYNATGNTQYPWQANWGEGKSATRNCFPIPLETA